MKKIVNCETGEELLRELTDAELAQQETDEQALQKEIEELAKKAEAKEELLKRLGITDSDLKTLLS